jgi:hypothetical protein
MDYTHANHHRFLDVLDVVCRSGIDGQRTCFRFQLSLCLLMHRVQASEHVIGLTFVFTTLVFIAATQGM